MDPAHIVTLNPNLPHALVDSLLTAVETALIEGGAVHLRVDPHQRDIVVLADLPDRRLADPA